MEDALDQRTAAAQDGQGASRPPSVYLDQNHWIALSGAIHNPASVSRPDELDAANAVIELARSGAIVLPLSAGHTHETFTIQHPERRRRLADTMLELSRGVVMRNPSCVRVIEFYRELQGGGPDSRCSTVVAQDSRLLFESFESCLGDPLPAVTVAHWRAGHLSTWGRWYHAVTEGDDTMSHDPDHESLHVAGRWAANQQRWADFMKEQPARGLRRGRSLLWTDYDTEAERAVALGALGETSKVLQRWYGDTTDPLLPTLEAHFAGMPALSVYRELAHARLVNLSDPWAKNDLTDMSMLSCAAAYCDVVVTEKKMGTYLRRLRDGGCAAVGATVHIRLADAVAELAPALR